MQYIKSKTASTAKSCTCLAQRRHLATALDTTPESIFAPKKPVVKRPHRQKPPNPGFGARLPRLAKPEEARKVYFPNFKIALMRNGPAHADDPYTATFKVPVGLTKPDIASFLRQVYKLGITGIRTVITQSPMTRMPLASSTKQRSYIGQRMRRKATKKAIVQLTNPFWYPKQEPAEFWNQHFEKDRFRAMNARKSKQIRGMGDSGWLRSERNPRINKVPNADGASRRWAMAIKGNKVVDREAKLLQVGRAKSLQFIGKQKQQD